MDKISINYELNSKARLDGFHEIMMRLTQNRSHVRISTRIGVSKNNFYNNRVIYVSKNDKNHNIKNVKLLNLKRNVHQYIFQLLNKNKSLKLSTIKDLIYTDINGYSVLKKVDSNLSSLLNSNSKEDYHRYVVFVSRFKKYLYGYDLKVNELNTITLESYSFFLDNEAIDDSTKSRELNYLKELRFN